MGQDERITIEIQTADKSKKARVTLPATLTISELMANCKKNWALPSSEDYAVRDSQRNIQLNSKDTLASAGISPGTTLEVYPLLEAGLQ
jgi:hypothetical protein